VTPRVRLLLAVVGLASILAFLFQPLVGPRDDAGPAVPTTGADAEFASRGLAPAGDIPRSPTSCLWTTDPLAAQYRFELRGPRGVLLYEALVADTMLAIPSGVVDWNIVSGGEWRVTSLRRDGRLAARAPVSFRIDSP
jgi:hypothetical protein